MSQAQNWHKQYTLLYPIRKAHVKQKKNNPRGFVKILHFFGAELCRFDRVSLHNLHDRGEMLPDWLWALRGRFAAGEPDDYACAGGLPEQFGNRGSGTGGYGGCKRRCSHTMCAAGTSVATACAPSDNQPDETFVYRRTKEVQGNELLRENGKGGLSAAFTLKQRGEQPPKGRDYSP